jgi:hypothetical protein
MSSEGKEKKPADANKKFSSLSTDVSSHSNESSHTLTFRIVAVSEWKYGTPYYCAQNYR